ncbi:(deoxy)nucleoside triphosphate pyrophosphohydrolase [Geobacter sp. SVR]|uniref:(deoxy)nucleoside triphosphate pyrophosphohydrolase n=1 Tax=Geobacter sp. SVR TaxID=2495594 RepID=UPI00143EFB81|nr:(deoxy)nucleoside triphosphate pyrophosphohydrolase [Geobacter sp. SVR]BCS52495.1 DNA mismatch repair protein MutT [Geobacter sp. SVR]GCF84068.1 NUDIX hydrolase [Geobacter sp. SVR]
MQTVSSESHHKHIHVACAIIERDGLVLAAQRSATMSMPLKWEFPGGKLDPGENPQECLEREVREELGLEVAIVAPLTATTHSYPDFTVTLYPFICAISAGEMILHEHAAIAWLLPQALHSVDWAEADGPIIAEYLRSLSPSCAGSMPCHHADFP